MLKEIHEQPESPEPVHRGRIDRTDHVVVDEIDGLADRLRDVDRIELIACGSAFYASLIGATALQEWTGLPVRRERRLGVPLRPAAARRADARDRGHPVGRDGRHDRPDPARARAWLSDHRGHQHRRLGHHPRGGRGPLPAGRTEIAVAASKTFVTQVTTLVILAAADRQGPRRAVRGGRAGARSCAAGAAGGRRPGTRRCARTSTADLARRYVNSRGFMFVGRGATYPVALEGALKLKEVSYVHAEGYAAGELKHGPISLLDAECPLVAVATRSAVYDKLISNVMEGSRPRRPRHRGRDRGRRGHRALRRRHLPRPGHARDAQPGPRDHPAPAVRVPHRGRSGHGRRPAAQPRQVGHGRIGRR